MKNYNLLYDFAKEFVKSTFKPFTSEDIRKSFFEKHPDLKWNVITGFGSVIKQLKSEGLIKSNGYATSTLKQAKSRIVRVWISREYSEKQQQNRSIKEQLKLL